MITIHIPDNFIPERTYIINVLLSEFLGLECNIVIKDSIQHYKIILENTNTLLIKDHFFSRFNDAEEYLDTREIPSQIKYMKNHYVPEDDIPVIYGSDELLVEKNRIVCGIDIFASSFFMLTRWEEYANKSRDSHGRFPSRASLAGKQGFLHRAVVNEYVELLWNMLCHLKMRQERKKREFRIFATHDVDAPFFYAHTGLLMAFRLMCGDIIARKKTACALNNFMTWVKVKRGRMELDHYYTFDRIMDISEHFCLKSNFLFITDRSYPAHDGDYSFDHPLLRKLMSNIRRRGHDIGLHLSYASFNNPGQTKKEFDILKRGCSEEGIEQEYWTSRQHFLRWETPTTFDNLEFAHLDFDSTLSYADAAGFRCGVCYEYPVFNILTRRCLRLRERPLLIMECTVIDERYMNLGSGERAFAYMKVIKDTCRRFNGDFVVLWHNTRFIDQQEHQLYKQILQV